MNILVVFAHPNYNQSIINKRFVEEIKKICVIDFHPLNELYPDGNIDIHFEKNALLRADRVVLQFPLHWYNMSPILKNYIKNVLDHGFAFGINGNKLKGKELLTAVTVGGPEEAYQRVTANSFTMEDFIKPFEQTAMLMGMNFRKTYAVYNAITLGRENNTSKLTKLAKEFIDHITDPYLDPSMRKKVS
ncbi:NAD(P)H-dependent oxidoreductase [Flammeovirga aprica]|uniref:NAD(P)H-dependent oxidoreductase n=1 Tax=Flammeovirga aprica JL-4 TaxID=694437 RepID=A0A7X9P2A3_9BACT|nr:NAD(P)H-dependent oxidoreductase [Flammeovirga aprica]NME68241.1 NAD(P)H-dependent oxidoreductase [Flammeovirga aprica JL-4]